jgi:phage terminase Nu1 subunit (DNA packaging protein)
MSTPATYPIDTIAKLLKLTPRRVQQLVAEGVIPKAERGRYELVPAVHGYIDYLKERAINGEVEGGESRDKARLLKARADIAEAEAQRVTGTLVPVGEVSRIWMDMMGRTKARLRSVPQKVAPLLSLETDDEVNRKTVETHIDEALNELADTPVFALPSDDGAGDAGRDREGDVEGAETAAETDGEPVGGSDPETVE